MIYAGMDPEISKACMLQIHSVAHNNDDSNDRYDYMFMRLLRIFRQRS